MSLREDGKGSYRTVLRTSCPLRGHEHRSAKQFARIREDASTSAYSARDGFADYPVFVRNLENKGQVPPLTSSAQSTAAVSATRGAIFRKEQVPPVDRRMMEPSGARRIGTPAAGPPTTLIQGPIADAMRASTDRIGARDEEVGWFRATGGADIRAQYKDYE